MGRYSAIGDDVDSATKWWNDYPTHKYTTLAKAETTFSNFISDVWSKPKRLGRSASYTNMMHIKETVHDYPIKRSESVSILAPSLGLLPQYDRQAERIVHTTPVYKPMIHNWYNGAYSTARYVDTQREINRPLRKEIPPYERFTHVPYFSLQAKRIFFEERAQPYKSYLRQSQQYLDRYVNSRLKADDFGQQYVHTAYEWHKPHDYAFNRSMFYGAKVNVPYVPSNPHSYNDAQALRRLYKTTGRFRFA
ncbi:hypothetical protein M3Y98_00782300 [Aphelenchoides besseyi]|nr:hypothetical protein M3Y98_00782300 [Aphelenchoides besseyi]KAI6211846.1 hypothetical protein M3Y96_00477600 [Aphelenchoides besseyi]